MPLRSVEAATRDDAIAAAREQFGPTARVVGVRRVRSGGVLGFFATERYVAEVASDSTDRAAVPVSAVSVSADIDDDVAPSDFSSPLASAAPARARAAAPARNGAAAWAAEAARTSRDLPASSVSSAPFSSPAMHRVSNSGQEERPVAAPRTTAPARTGSQPAMARADQERVSELAGLLTAPATAPDMPAYPRYTRAEFERTGSARPRDERPGPHDDVIGGGRGVASAAPASAAPSPFTAALARMVAGDRDVRQAVREALDDPAAPRPRGAGDARPARPGAPGPADTSVASRATRQKEETVGDQVIAPSTFADQPEVPAWAAEPEALAPSTSSREEAIAEVLRSALAQGHSDETLAGILRKVLAGVAPQTALAEPEVPVRAVPEIVVPVDVTAVVAPAAPAAPPAPVAPEVSASVAVESAPAVEVAPLGFAAAPAAAPAPLFPSATPAYVPPAPLFAAPAPYFAAPATFSPPPLFAPPVGSMWGDPSPAPLWGEPVTVSVSRAKPSDEPIWAEVAQQETVAADDAAPDATAASGPLPTPEDAPLALDTVETARPEDVAVQHQGAAHEAAGHEGAADAAAADDVAVDGEPGVPSVETSAADVVVADVSAAEVPAAAVEVIEPAPAVEIAAVEAAVVEAGVAGTQSPAADEDLVPATIPADTATDVDEREATPSEVPVSAEAAIETVAEVEAELETIAELTVADRVEEPATDATGEAFDTEVAAGPDADVEFRPEAGTEAPAVAEVAAEAEQVDEPQSVEDVVVETAAGSGTVDEPQAVEAELAVEAEPAVAADTVEVAGAEAVAAADPETVAETDPVTETVAEAVAETVEAETGVAAEMIEDLAPMLARTASDPAPMMSLDVTTVMPPLSLLPPLPSSRGRGRPPVPPASRPLTPRSSSPAATPSTPPVSDQAAATAAGRGTPVEAPGTSTTRSLATVTRLPVGPLMATPETPETPELPELDSDELDDLDALTSALFAGFEAAALPEDDEPDVVEPSVTATAFSVPAVPGDLRDRLAALGLPGHLLGETFAEDAAGHGTYAALTRALGLRLPSAPELPSGAGDVLFVVGPGFETLRAARSLAVSLRLDPDDVQWATRGELAGLAGKGSRITTVDTAMDRSQDAASSGTVTIVAVDAPLRTDAYWMSQMLAIWSPTAVWVVVEATRKPEDLGPWIGGLPRVDALVVTDTDLSADPAAVLRQVAAPVALLDGVRATPHRWASLLCERLESTQA